MVLGRDFMKKFKTVTFNLNKNWVKFDNHVVRDKNNREKEPIKLAEDIKVPARSERIIAVKCWKENSMIESMFLSKGILGYPGIYAASAVVIPNAWGVFHVSFVNVNDREIIIKKRKSVGMLSPATDYERHNESAGSPIKIVDTENCVRAENLNISPSLSPSQRNNLSGIIDIYKQVFTANPWKPESTDKVAHKIITNESQPQFRKPYRIPHAHMKEYHTPT